VFELIKRYRQCDPAARSDWEVALLYPGIKAVLFHQLAHRLWRARQWFAARLVAEISRFVTGIEIHPGAKLGAGLVIDHGMGVVVGETTVIGRNVLIYHGATLGATTGAHGKRHPTIEDDVIIGAGAKILGPITVGQGARIGANAVVTAPVLPHSIVVGIPAKPLAARSQVQEVTRP
jgi:serine O-acetyltransferase